MTAQPLQKSRIEYNPDMTCPHCRAVLESARGNQLATFPGLDPCHRQALASICGVMLYIDGDSLPLPASLSFLEKRVALDFLLGVCPFCDQYYYGLRIGIISAQPYSAFDDCFDEDEATIGPVNKSLYQIHHQLQYLPKQTTWYMERLDSVYLPQYHIHPMQVYRHWIGPLKADSPAPDPQGVVVPKDPSKAPGMWSEVMQILSEVLPAIDAECTLDEYQEQSSPVA